MMCVRVHVWLLRRFSVAEKQWIIAPWLVDTIDLHFLVNGYDGSSLLGRRLKYRTRVLNLMYQ